MWYPLKNSLTALVLAAAALFVLLQGAAPLQPAPSTDARNPAQLVLSATRLAARLPIDDPDARLAIAIALHSASAIVHAVEREDADRTGNSARRDEARRRVAMPYFSFGATMARNREPGA